MACATLTIDARNEFSTADANGDEVLTFLEWVNHKSDPQDMALGMLAQRWALYDVEGKGYLTKHEALHRKAGGHQGSSKTGLGTTFQEL